MLSPNEVNQSLVRSANTVAILVYLIIYSYTFTGKIFVSYTVPAIVYLILTIPLYFWSLRCVSFKDSCKEKISYRVIGLTGDIVFLSIVMVYAGNAGIPLFFVYLWIIVGNGIRYGNKYLVISTAISIICFVFVLFLTPAWQSSQLLLIAIGLLISMIILPTYVLSLISRLSKALESEKTANQFKKSFLANINHEIRTPLNSILSLADLIRKHSVPKEVHKMAGMISISANSQLKIINSILDISKIEAGEYKLEKRPFNLYELISEVHQIMLPQAISKNLTFYVYIDPNCAQDVDGEYDQIKQILINLAANAIKFTEYGYVRLSVNMRQNTAKRQCLAFAIEDTGIGIPIESQTEIFKPFIQADSSITKKYGGTGLGVAISDELTKLIAGTLSLKSEVDKGTTFTLEVFLDKADITTDYKFKNIQLLPLNINGKHSKILNSYADLGLKIIDVETYNLDLADVSQDGRTIVLLDVVGLDPLLTEFVLTLNINSVPIITIKNEINDNNLHMAITSIDVNQASDQLFNAIKIASVFRANSVRQTLNYSEMSHSLNILMAEDDPTLIQINKMMFASMSHRVNFVINGIDALNALNDNEYDVAILDMHMPGLSGVDVAIQYRALNQNADISLILLTADIYYAKVDKGNLSVFDHVLIKPVTPSELLDVVNSPRSFRHYRGNKGSITNNTKHTESNLMLDYVVVENNLSAAGAKGMCDLLDIYDKEVKSKLHGFTLKTPIDYLEIKGALHQLKGAANTIGAILFGETIHMHENLVENYEDDKFHEFIANLFNMHSSTITAYRNYLANI